MGKNQGIKRFFVLFLSAIFIITQVITVPTFAVDNNSNEHETLQVRQSLIPKTENNTYRVGESFNIDYEIKPKDIEKKEYDNWYKSNGKKKEIVMVIDTSTSMDYLLEPTSYNIDDWILDVNGFKVMVNGKKYDVKENFWYSYITIDGENYYIEGNRCYREHSNCSNIKNRLDATKDSAMEFLKKFENDKNVSIGLVSFASKGEKKQVLTSNLKDVKNSINKLQVCNNGATNIEDGLKKAQEVLKIGEEDADKYVVLMTDGFPTAFNYSGEKVSLKYNKYEIVDNTFINYGCNDYNGFALKHAMDQASELKKNNINSFIIGFSNGVNSEKLNEIAKSAAGKYEEAKDKNALNDAYEKIATRVKLPLIKNIKFKVNVPEGLEVQEVKNCMTNEGGKGSSNIELDLGNISYDMNNKDENKYLAEKSLKINLKVKGKVKGNSSKIGASITYINEYNQEKSISIIEYISIIENKPTQETDLKSKIKLEQTTPNKDVYKINESIPITYTITPPNTVNKCEYDKKYNSRKKKIVLVVDTSGSMEESIERGEYYGELVYYFDAVNFRWMAYLDSKYESKSFWHRIPLIGWIIGPIGDSIMETMKGPINVGLEKIVSLGRTAQSMWIGKLGKWFIGKNVDIMEAVFGFISDQFDAISPEDILNNHIVIKGKGEFYVENGHCYKIKRGNSRLNSVKKVAKTFLDQFENDTNAEVALVGYSNKAYKVSDYNNISGNFVNGNNISVMKNRIDSLRAEGGTNIGDGIRKAYSMLDSCDTDTDKYVVLMTDGVPTAYTCYSDSVNVANDIFDTKYYPIGQVIENNRKYYYNKINKFEYKLENDNRNESYIVKFGDEYDKNALEYAKETATKAKDKGIKNFIVGFSDGINSDKLKEIADSGNALYREAKSEDELADIYNEIAEKIKKPSIKDITFELNVPKGLEVADNNANKGILNVKMSEDKRKLKAEINDIYYSKIEGNYYVIDKNKSNKICFTVNFICKQKDNYVLGNKKENSAYLNYIDVDGTRMENLFTPEIYINMKKIKVTVGKFGILKSALASNMEECIQDNKVLVMNNFMYKVGTIIKVPDESNKSENVDVDINIKLNLSIDPKENGIKNYDRNEILIYTLQNNKLKLIAKSTDGCINIKPNTIKTGQKYILVQQFVYTGQNKNFNLNNNIEINNNEKITKALDVVTTNNLPDLD